MAKITFTVCITEEDGSFWAEVEQLPGCFASGFSVSELQEATEEAIQLYLPDGIDIGKVKWELPDELVARKKREKQEPSAQPSAAPKRKASSRRARALIHA